MKAQSCSYLIFWAFLLFSPTVVAQQESITIDPGAVRSFHAFGPTGIRKFESNNEAQDVVARITRHVPVGMPIEALVSDDAHKIPNAEAYHAKNKPVIGFNRAFMREIRNTAAGNYWSLIGIAAHEVGHHARNHLMFNDEGFQWCREKASIKTQAEIAAIEKKNHEQELQADYYAGFALGKMGAKRDDAVSGMRALPGESGSCTHPDRERRVRETQRGWQEATQGQTANATRVAGWQATSDSLSKFTVRRNRDIYGHDIETIPGLGLDTCAARCDANSSCKAFSFDRWKGWCFLKGELATTLLDPPSVIGVRKSLELPKVAQVEPVIVELKRKRFSEQPNDVATNVEYEQCKASCQTSLNCVAYQYTKPTRTCGFYKETTGYFYDETVDAGYKRQTATQTTTRQIAASIRIDRVNDRYFKGDGYIAQEQATTDGCDNLCLKDARCQANEYMPGRRQCRLYSAVESAFAANGTIIGYKRN